MAKPNSVDIKPYLLGTAPVYLDLLRKWSQYPALTSHDMLYRIVDRYANRWLPLAAEWCSSRLEPPLDVHWAWHLHMLHPRRYADHCTRRFRRIVPHEIGDRKPSERRAAVEKARIVWRDAYPNEPYDIDLDTANPGTYVDLPDPDLACVVEAAQSAMAFGHQVSLPHYRDANFLFRAMMRYKQLLMLLADRRRRWNKEKIIALPVDIVLMWKVHAMFPVDYYDEVLRYCRLDSVRPDPDGGRYDDADWSALYEPDPLLVPGSGYRGDLRHRSALAPAPDLSVEPTFDRCRIAIDEISVGGIRSRDRHVTVVVRLLGATSLASDELLRLKTAVDRVNRAEDGSRGLVTFAFDRWKNRSVEFDVYAERSQCCGCRRRQLPLGTLSFSPQSAFPEGHFVSRDFPYQLEGISCIDPKVAFRCHVQACPPKPLVFRLTANPFKPTRQVPEVLLAFVHALPKWRTAIEAAKANKPESSSEFMKATHELESRDEKHSFRIETIKQYDLDLSAVLVYHNNDRLVALAHSVGDETIASPRQLTTTCPLSLDAEADELAMSICNHQGDWAVCKGSWAYHSRGSQVKMSVVYPNSDDKQFNFAIDDDELKTIAFDEISIDVQSGRVSIDSRSRTVAEDVALAFSVGLIYVSCQVRAAAAASANGQRSGGAADFGSVRSCRSTGDLVRPSDPNATKPSPGSLSLATRRRNRKMNRRRRLSASYTFLRASGLLIEFIACRTSDQSKDGTAETGLSDARNNNHPSSGTNHIVNARVQGHSLAIDSLFPTSNGVNGYLYHASGPTSITSFIGRGQGDAVDYMDVRL